MKRNEDFNHRLKTIDDLPGRKRSNFPEISDETFWKLYEKAKPFSLVHVTGFFNVFQSLNYIARNRLAGDIVECGCFLGGVGIFMALLRGTLGMSEKTITLFDSFEGFPMGEVDAKLGKPISSNSYSNTHADVVDNIMHAVGSLDGISLVPGFVENTLPVYDSGPLCLLRLDTDFYNSTKVELETLYQRLVPGGVIIVDDYGLFQGARRATDEFFAKCNIAPLLNRIDRGVWAGVKPVL